MVLRLLTAGVCTFALCIAQSATAGTIIKLGLGGDSAPDITYTGGVLSTVDDGDGATNGNQNTHIEFSDFLSGEADVTTPIASFSLSGVTQDGNAELVGGGDVVIQRFTGGSLSLYDPANSLLLSGDLTSSILVGSMGSSATGSVFSIDLGNVTGGSLASQILPGSLSLSVSLNNVNGGAGFSVSGTNPALQDFTADATASIAGDVIPEPASILLVLAAAAGGFMAMGRRR